MFDWELQEKFDHLTDTELEKPGYLEAIFAVMNVIINEDGTGEKKKAAREAPSSTSSEARMRHLPNLP